MPELFKQILPKPGPCENTDREDTACATPTVHSYRGADGKRYRLCRQCSGVLARLAPLTIGPLL